MPAPGEDHGGVDHQAQQWDQLGQEVEQDAHRHQAQKDGGDLDQAL